MTPNQLKNSILQLAIQGKLTESWRLSVKRLENRDERKEDCLLNRVFCHNRHCEPAESWRGNPDLLYADAETLLKTISEEKEALIKQGKLKKEKNESIIFKRGNSYFEKVGTTEKCIDDELPFEIPDSWRWAKLGKYFFSRLF